MIRLVTALVIFLLSQVIQSQTKFEQGMQQAFALMAENKNEEAANTFERIAQVETDNWLPYYNLALLKTRTTFQMKDKIKVAAELKAAEEFADKADVISPDNSEIYVLKAFINTAKIVMDPMTNGAALSPVAIDLYQKALRLNNKNPRAHSGLVEFEMGSARYFNQDLTPYCKKLKTSLAMYQNFKPESKFHPNWGEDRVVDVLKMCGETEETSEEMKTVSITVKVPNVAHDKGTVVFALYTKETFNGVPLQSASGKIKEGMTSVTFTNVAPGEYAIMSYHDANDNNKMDFAESGMPNEDYGLSNNPTLMGPPTFDVAKFTVENKSVDLTIKFKKMILRKFVSIVLVMSSMLVWSQSTVDLKVNFEGLSSDKGKLFVALYNQKDNFLKTEFKGEIMEIKNGKATVVFKDLPKGIYAVSSFHDENNNGKLDTNWVGIPNEPNACSNNATGSFGPPKFKDAKFSLEKRETTIKIKY